MIPRVQSVQAGKNYVLHVTFDNEVRKQYDMKPCLATERFAILKDRLLFSMVVVDAGGYGVSWDDQIDLSEHELWVNGKEPSMGEC